MRITVTINLPDYDTSRNKRQGEALMILAVSTVFRHFIKTLQREGLSERGFVTRCGRASLEMFR